MKLFINIRTMTFEEENNQIEHKIVSEVSDIKFYGYDLVIDLKDDDEFIKNNLKFVYKKDKEGKDTKEIKYKMFVVREEETWWSFPLFEIIKGKIVTFEYKNYEYFANTDRRMILAKKINQLYNPPSEWKVLRKTLKYIMDTLKIDYPDYFKKYNDKIEELINKNPKGEK